jgi:D-beta-D-heptose 7-phosphate kinase / D-beta-D-heptose 1-phosphate adenosyltransferase
MKNKVASAARAADIRNRLRRQGKKVVFTNGCFDLIHSGHALYLESARKLGDFLIVGLNGDDSVRRLKGSGRPLMPYKERALLLSFLSPVDLVVRFDEDTPLRLIERLRPDVLAKGADYKHSEIVGAAEVRKWGGRVRRIRLVKGKSTSGLIRRILETRR